MVGAPKMIVDHWLVDLLIFNIDPSSPEDVPDAGDQLTFIVTVWRLRRCHRKAPLKKN